MTASPAFVAVAFCRKLIDAVGADTVAEIVSLNTADGSRDGDAICHSHDFIDANEVMRDAMSESIGRDPLDVDADIGPMSADDIDLWNKAWSIAKLADFDPAIIPT